MTTRTKYPEWRNCWSGGLPIGEEGRSIAELREELAFRLRDIRSKNNRTRSYSTFRTGYFIHMLSSHNFRLGMARWMGKRIKHGEK